MADNRGSQADWTRLSGIGIELAAAVAGFALAGYWWDRHFGTAPRGLLIGSVLGIVGGLLNAIRAARRAMSAASGEPRDGDGDTQHR